MTKREPFLTIEEIREKCEQYWNERGVLDEELHSILSFIHVRASKLNAAFEARVEAERERSAFDIDRILKWALDVKRKPAITAFTEGPERQVAYLIESSVQFERERCAKIAETRTDGDWQGHTIAEEIRSGK